MWHAHDRRRPRLIAATAAVAFVSGCAATTSVQWNQPLVVAALPSTGPVFVMEPVIQGIAPPGNVGRNLPAIGRDVLNRILAIVRERFPGAEIAEPGPEAAMRALPGYVTAAGGRVAAWVELDAARRAHERGATHLLVPTITDWKEMRIDDPIGAVTVPHDTVTLTLRLMALQPPAVVGHVTFTNRGRLTLNRPADRLLNDQFRSVVLRLISGSTLPAS
jgi:hypothetical protein